ncbi:MAG: arylsulfatase [Verrucomicrobia bacterium]|nr:arylsulfatase [Verrucomicrobiota bacterium]MDA1068656.1 arylsulfatase [Verrucomicrobiota bacterium]
MKSLFLCFVLGLIVLTGCSKEVESNNLSKAAGVKPNIILMMADDMGMGDTSAYQDFTGNADSVQVRTPQMERLADLGMRFTDAHTPSSRCSPTRYGLLTGRYPWRNRLKHWVLFGSQGDPMIEADRPTIASMLRDHGYTTAMFGKWHVGLRYRQADGRPAAGWDDADLTQPLHTSPIDHGFDIAKFTSRSHGTSGPNLTDGKPIQFRGPGHIDGRVAIAATGVGRETEVEGPDAYIWEKLGSRHSDNAVDFLDNHIGKEDTQNKPFFLYYPSNSNHGPYTPDDSIGGVPVAGAARTVSGESMDKRHNYIYENDVALGRLIDWLQEHDDPRNPGKKLFETTILIFTSDNGAEKDSDIATGPFRSHKGSVYEGGHRVPFIVSWPEGGVGVTTNPAPISLQDLYATFAEIVGAKLPELGAGEKGAEDSYSILSAFKGADLSGRSPLFFNDHKEAKEDPAVLAMRLDSPTVNGHLYQGQWKLFFDPQLLRAGKAKPYELYNLAEDQWETTNLINDSKLGPLKNHLTSLALHHRNAGGHRYTEFADSGQIVFDWEDGHFSETETINGITLSIQRPNDSMQVNSGEAILIRFDKNVIVDSAAIVAGEGVCGGFYTVGNHAPLAIYCVDADLDDKDQSGVLSDIGFLKAGEILRLDSSPHFGVEASGQWRLEALSVRAVK